MRRGTTLKGFSRWIGRSSWRILPEWVQLLVGYLVERWKKESHAVLLAQTSESHQLMLRSLDNKIVHPTLCNEVFVVKRFIAD